MKIEQSYTYIHTLIYLFDGTLEADALLTEFFDILEISYKHIDIVYTKRHNI